jgi:hypothetical protein
MVKFNLRIPEDLYEKAKAAAAADDRSLNSWLITLVRQAVSPGQMSDRSDGDPAIPASQCASGHSPRP